MHMQRFPLSLKYHQTKGNGCFVNVYVILPHFLFGLNLERIVISFLFNVLATEHLGQLK